MVENASNFFTDGPYVIVPFVQIPYEQTQAINQWRNVGKSPFSDQCLIQLTSEERYDENGNLEVEDETRGVYLECTYDEDITTASAKLRSAMDNCGG